MDIHGLQKLTLLDYPGHVACTVFLAGCNFRCPYCHNSELLTTDVIAETDDSGLLSFLRKRKGILDGVAITGGEPLMTKELPTLLDNIKELGYLVKLDTNGTFPERLKNVVNAGLVDYVAMDIKNSTEKYHETVGCVRCDLSLIYESVEFLVSGNTDYEFRTTVVDELHDEASFRGIGEMIHGAKKYYIQPFVNRDTVLFENLHSPEKEKLARYLDIIREYIPNAELRGEEL